MLEEKKLTIVSEAHIERLRESRMIIILAFSRLTNVHMSCVIRISFFNLLPLPLISRLHLLMRHRSESFPQIDKHHTL